MYPRVASDSHTNDLDSPAPHLLPSSKIISVCFYAVLYALLGITLRRLLI